MKAQLICGAALLAAVTLASAQTKPTAETETATVNGKTITVKYAAPSVNGREGKIFTKDGLISHDGTYPAWRAGANTATALHTDADLKFGSLAVPAGDYTLYVDLSNPEQWTLIVNKQVGQWGTKYDKAQDLGRVKMTMSKPSAQVEKLRYKLTDLGGDKGKLQLDWENYSASAGFSAK